MYCDSQGFFYQTLIVYLLQKGLENKLILIPVTFAKSENIVYVPRLKKGYK